MGVGLLDITPSPIPFLRYPPSPLTATRAYVTLSSMSKHVKAYHIRFDGHWLGGEIPQAGAHILWDGDY